ncbi:GAF domain-containing protein [Sphingomonas changnyeongensis]|uniref:GAF domain-containing protein n=1 Tax=Sphingomonas changnyeongensis TaxID=2698679 RepID=A0A7Z2NWB6_9SPHN|nr:GAF domain-containing protein [Sphingomonas changnyeongensis]QHL90439.1 GAF domain-containing protein [Sphingomonas changnyeongensis]
MLETQFIGSSRSTATERARLVELLTAAPAALDESALIDLLFAQAPARLGLDVCFTYRADLDRQMLHVLCVRGLDPVMRDALDGLAFGEFLCGRVARDRRPVVMRDIGHSTDPACAAARKLSLGSYCGFPMIAPDGKLFGVAAFASRSRRWFHDDEVAMFSDLAAEIGLRRLRRKAAA